MSKSSLSELQDQLLISKDVEYIDKVVYEDIEFDINTVQKIISKFIQKTESFIQ
jgi:four helix bundle protein